MSRTGRWRLPGAHRSQSARRRGTPRLAGNAARPNRSDWAAELSACPTVSVSQVALTRLLRDQPALLKRASCKFSRRFFIRSLLLISAPTSRNGACNEYHHGADAAGLPSDPVLPCQGVESKRGRDRQGTV